MKVLGLFMKKRIFSGIIVFFLIILGINGVLQILLTAFENDSYQLFFNNAALDQRGYCINGTPYLPVSLIGSYAKNSGISVDTSNKRLIIDLASQNIRMADDATTNFVKTYAGNVYIPLREIEGRLYFPLNTTDQFFKLSYAVLGHTIRIRDYSMDKIAAEAGLSKIDFYAPKKAKFKREKNERICLAWDYVSTVSQPAPPVKYDGLDIIAPTWFHLIAGGDGSVDNNGDKGYADSAHSNGYMVWATITNNMSTPGSTVFTTKTFNNSELLSRSVAQYIFYSCLYDADGINIDYEGVSDADAAGLVEFTALMRNYTERQGLILSIDTLIPKPWTVEYDRAALSKYVDYLAVMTYDEHYAGSPAAGSIASMPWVEEAVKETLKEIPAPKLLLGIPLYTRIWTVDSAGKIISNSTATMPTVRDIVGSKQLTPKWLNKEKQYYVEYPNGVNTSKIWIEDSRSIANRLNLVSKYKLAGAACWQINQGEDQIWDVFEGMLKEGKSLSNYQKGY